MVRRLLLVAVAGLLAGCANPLNRATSDRYAQQCADAYRDGLLDVAEQACYRAAVNVNLGNLGPELKSERWYNLALIKRALRKLNEADELLTESLKVEETLSGPSSEKTGRRLAELAAVKYQKAQYTEGFPLMERLAPMTGLYSGKDRAFLAALFHCYTIQAEQAQQAELAGRFKTVSSSLGPPPSGLNCRS
jgi:hypothetical protein